MTEDGGASTNSPVSKACALPVATPLNLLYIPRQAGVCPHQVTYSGHLMPGV